MTLDGFRALLFVRPEKDSTLPFATSFSDKSFHTMSFKIRVIMTWLAHYIIFLNNKEMK